MKRLLRILVLGALSGAWITPASALPCLPGTLSDYVALGAGGCSIGGTAFGEFAVEPFPGGAIDLDPGRILLTPIVGGFALVGDVEGALEMMGAAYARLPEAEIEERAWVLTQVAHLYLGSGRLALDTFPDYHYALAQLGRLRIAQDRSAEAVAILERWYSAAPHPKNLYVLANAFGRAGRDADARKAFAEFEVVARREADGNDNANRELTFYYVDRAHDARAALAVAEREFSRRKDVYTRESYAWALASDGRLGESRTRIEEALAVGTQDADMYYRAGSIADRQGDAAAASRYYERSLAINAHWDSAPAARVALAARK